jgi:hypothetical protein
MDTEWSSQNKYLRTKPLGWEDDFTVRHDVPTRREIRYESVEDSAHFDLFVWGIVADVCDWAGAQRLF